MKLKGQVAIITGAGRNIGEATAKLLALEGAKIAVVDFDKERGDRVAQEIVASGGEAKGFIADISKEEDIVQLMKDVVSLWGGIDILVNNAAVSDNKHVLEITTEEWNKVIAVTLTGPFLMSKLAAIEMIKKGAAGKIVNVGSTSGFYGRKRAVAYASAKGGLVSLTRALAVQLASHNIRVNAVIPNKIGSPVGKSEFDPTRPVVNLKGRNGFPIDLARAVLFLVSDDSDFIVGDLLFVDGGVSAMMVGD